MITKKVKLPKKKTKPFKREWFKFEIGSSDWFEKPENRTLNSFQSQISCNANNYCQRNKLKWKWATRIENNGIRIWRIK